MHTIFNNENIPEEIMFAMSNYNFIQSDIKLIANKQILIFFSELDRNTITNAKIWLCDGTLKITPRDFHQVLIIHCSLFDKFIPFIYVLLPDKAGETYVEMLNLLFEI